jgi:hypothetical protein
LPSLATTVEPSPSNKPYCFRHADAAKLHASLEVVRKAHAIAMEGLNTQLQKSLAENSLLEEQLKDQQCIGLQKQKEIDDLC